MCTACGDDRLAIHDMCLFAVSPQPVWFRLGSVDVRSAFDRALLHAAARHSQFAARSTMAPGPKVVGPGPWPDLFDDLPADDDIAIHVTFLSGKTITLDVMTNDTISGVKGDIQEKEGIPSKQQRLTFDGLELVNDATLFDYNIQQETTLHCVVSSCACEVRMIAGRATRLTCASCYQAMLSSPPAMSCEAVVTSSD